MKKLTLKQQKIVLAQQEKLVIAQEDGLRAWRMLVVNHMLARQFMKTRQYKWRTSELAQIAGIPPENVVIGRSERDTENI